MKVLRYVKHYWWLIVLIVCLTYLQVMANLQLPDYMADIVNNGIIQKNQQIIYHYGWLMIAVSFGGAIAAILGGLLAARVAAGFARDTRHAVFSRVEDFSIKEFDEFSTASLLTRSTNDIQQMQQVLVMLLRMVLIAPFMAVGAIQKAVSNAPGLSWLIWLAVAVVFVVIVFMFIVVLPKFTLIQSLVDKLNLVARENLTGLRVVRAFHKEAYEEAKFEHVNTELTALNLFVNRMMTLMQPLMMLVLNGTTLAIVWYGARLIDTGTINIGNMLAFMQYGMQVIMSFLMVSIIFIMVPRAVVSARRVSAVLATKPSICDVAGAKILPTDTKGEVTFSDVSFAYAGGEAVLKHINFTAKPGEMTALIGGTGSGKTTLISLIPRLYDVTDGRVMIDGTDVRQVTQKSLRSLIGFVPQKATLFSGTFYSNVVYGNHRATRGLVDKVVNIAQAKHFVDESPDGLESAIAQGGSNVSGGQKQRLSIARALAVQPRIYIFDDSFSALDLKTDKALRKALAPFTKESTVIIVAQRIGTILHADKIIVLDEGRIVGEGTHMELMRSSEVYREIAHSQLSDEEIAMLIEEDTHG